MKKLIFILLVSLTMLVSGCINAGDIAKQVDKEDIDNISSALITCEKPYIRHGAECCLDKNNNKICDSDENKTEPTKKEKVSENKNKDTNKNKEIKPVEKKPKQKTKKVKLGDCAEHFTKIKSRAIGRCGNGLVDGSPIKDAYECKLETDYPSANSCPTGTKMNNTYGSIDGFTPLYTCYVSQKIGTTNPPEGCPIQLATVSCADGFTYDDKTSNLKWSNGDSSWGCFFKCKANPDPLVSNKNWPCTKEGYKPKGDGDIGICCAKW